MAGRKLKTTLRCVRFKFFKVSIFPRALTAPLLKNLILWANHDLIYLKLIKIIHLVIKMTNLKHEVKESKIRPIENVILNN